MFLLSMIQKEVHEQEIEVIAITHVNSYFTWESSTNS